MSLLTGVLLGSIVPAGTAQPLDPTIPTGVAPVSPLFQSTPQTSLSESTDFQQVPLRLPQLIDLVLEGNRELRDALLERIVQQQQLVEAESRFDPDITPRLSLAVTQRLEDSENEFVREDRTTTDESARVTAETLTPIGTRLELAIDPLDDQPVELIVRQPLLRGFGERINRAPITQARLTEQRNQLALQQQTTETITQAITSYTDLIQQQEAVRIQEQALERRRDQNAIINALVQAGRRPRVDLVEADGNIANAERDLQNARNQLAQANTNLLNLIGSDEPIQFVASLDEVARWFTAALEQVPSLKLTALLETAYQQRPDYRRAQLATQVEQVSVDIAADNQRWQLDAEGRATMGDDAEARLGLVVTRPLGDERLETERRRSQVNLLQSENELARVTTAIRNEVTTRLEDVRSNQLRVEAARRASEAAALQLQGDREKFRRGRGGVTLLDLSQREEALVNAQNAQLEAEIAFLNSLTQLEQAVGITLITWESQINFTPALDVPTLP
ncbi:TolC family protein [Leptolyngbya sp. FACHB-8]|nr:TolC family protein [Leptolyngbya sp. FACHB-8]MBD1912111.1 TolC family protein [Leptolyngbya sp. FACHB-8]